MTAVVYTEKNVDYSTEPYEVDLTEIENEFFTTIEECPLFKCILLTDSCFDYYNGDNIEVDDLALSFKQDVLEGYEQ